MSVKYTSVLWNQQKKRYDLYLWLGILLFITTYVISQLGLRPNISIETLIIRATGLSAFILLHLILIIGPLARINTNILPLLYNRRHAGVSMFLLALVHGIFSIIQFHALGDTHPILSVFLSNQNYLAVSQFPFQVLGFIALLIFMMMAATSHDYWLKNLGARTWKALHMSVYVAYVLIILHVATGAFQYESHPLNWALLILGFLIVLGLHLYSGILVNKDLSKGKNEIDLDNYVRICALEEIEESRAKTVYVDGENIAVFKYEGKVSAVHNVCKHQQGPLGEGKIIDGCITCPWHGYQYHPHNGQSPPPFQEKVCTYAVKIKDGDIWLDPSPHEEGTPVEAATFSNSKSGEDV